MGEKPEINGGRSRFRLGLWAGVALAGLAAGTVLYLQAGVSGKGAPVAPSDLAIKLGPQARGEVAAFVVHDQPKAIEAVTFKDGDGKDHTLAEWRGKLVLLNLWATWCAPCRHEMPALDGLKDKLGGKDFDVVALSTDRGGMEKPRKFWADTAVKSLGLYIDSGDATHGLGVIGMPTTLLIGRDGRELGRLVGPAEWSSLDAANLVGAALKLN